MSLVRKDDDLFPYEIRNVDPETDALIKENFPGERRYDEYVQVGPQKWFFPKIYAEQAEIYYNFEFRKDDVVIVTFPRSGTTLTQEMLWLLCNDFNYVEAGEHHLTDRFPFLEYDILTRKRANTEPKWKVLTNSQNKRFIKTHLPFALLPQNLTKVGCKIVYVARNPKDVAISNYHLQRFFSVEEDSGDAQKYWKLFTNNLNIWSPYWEHVKEGWRNRDKENVLFIFYEDMIKDLRSTIEKVSTFLGKSCTPTEIETLAKHLNIDNFRKNKSVNMESRKLVQINKAEDFIRKGKTGGWKEYFDEDMDRQANDWIEKNLKDTDLIFPI